MLKNTIMVVEKMQQLNKKLNISFCYLIIIIFTGRADADFENTLWSYIGKLILQWAIVHSAWYTTSFVTLAAPPRYTCVDDEATVAQGGRGLLKNFPRGGKLLWDFGL